MRAYDNDNVEGKRFGHWTVLRRVQAEGTRNPVVEVKCDCGVVARRELGNLRKRDSPFLACNRCSAERRFDLTGRRFGLLTVIRVKRTRKSYKWECVCDCGKKVVKSASSLNAGEKPSCGCTLVVKEDITGRRFGHLTVIGLAGNVSCKNRNSCGTTWKCICDCGQKTVVQRSSLISGDTRSCGCGRRRGLLKRLGGGKLAHCVANAVNIWKKETWPYASAGKEDVCEMIMENIEKADLGKLRFLSLPGNGRELKAFDREFELDYSLCLGVEKNHPRRLKRFLESLYFLRELEGIVPVIGGDIDKLMLSERMGQFNVIHQDYNGPLTMKHVQATERALETQSGIVAVTVNQNSRGWDKMKYVHGCFPLKNVKWQNIETLFYQPYKGIAGQPMETYCFRSRGKVKQNGEVIHG